MLCSVSGTTPEEPVISKKSGHLFEKRIIEQYIAQHGTCPVTGEPLTNEDLLEVKGSKVPRPRPAQATSIPGLLQLLQNEWDALMIESFTMKQHLETVRQELSHALYQHDAACRVIARLIKERDNARQQLAQFQTRLEQERGEAQADDVMAEAEGKLPQSVIQKMQDVSTVLTTKRKKRVISDNLAAPEEIAKFQTSASISAHSTTTPGIIAVDVHPVNDKMVLSGGVDGLAVFYDRVAGQITGKLTGHTKAVRRVLQHPSAPIAFTASDDATVRIWKQAEGAWKAEHVLREHRGAVRGLTLNASHEFIVTAGIDNQWNFFDIETATCLAKVKADEIENPIKEGFTSAQFHPDGMILGTGTVEKIVSIWDLRTLNNVATFESHAGSVTSLSFSENGFYLATSSTDGTVKLWDLRKLVNFRTLTFEDSNPAKPTPVNSTVFDFSGQYLAIAADNVKLYSTKTWNEIKVIGEHSQSVTDVAWGTDAKWLASASLDRHLNIYTAQ